MRPSLGGRINLSVALRPSICTSVRPSVPCRRNRKTVLTIFGVFTLDTCNWESKYMVDFLIGVFWKVRTWSAFVTFLRRSFNWNIAIFFANKIFFPYAQWCSTSSAVYSSRTRVLILRTRTRTWTRTWTSGLGVGVEVFRTWTQHCVTWN